MSKKEDGGLAFPLHYEVFEKSEMMVHHEGMSLRDYFAGQVDIPWDSIINTLMDNNNQTKVTLEEIINFRATAKYAEADAMIKERKK